MHEQTTIHTPVLLDAVLRMAAPRSGESYLDLTAGYGGHAGAIIAATSAADRAVLVDQDAAAIAALEPFGARGANIRHADFLGASTQLATEQRQFDVVLADLGVSSLHLDHPERGFAFRAEGPLDMRMDQRRELTAADVVNGYDEARLADIIYQYGEESHSRSIARRIVESRPISNTGQLAEIVRRAIPPRRRGRVHPATKTFQAIRIAVNDELGQLEKALPLWLQLLTPCGRLLVISFHSLEDRMVKKAFADVSGERYDADFRLLARHPITADTHEIDSNPRARSAKLRGVAKINTNKERGMT